MVMSRSRRLRKNDSLMPVDITPSVAEAERLLEEARRAEAEREAEMARQAEQDLLRRAEFEREAATLVTAIETRVQEAVAEAGAAEVVPSRELRHLARGWLHGCTQPYGHELMTQEEIMAVKDGTTGVGIPMKLRPQ